MSNFMFFDVAGREVRIGDRVASTYHGYSDMQLATVVGFTPKKIKLVFDFWRRGRLNTPISDEDIRDHSDTKFSNQLVVVVDLLN